MDVPLQFHSSKRQNFSKEKEQEILFKLEKSFQEDEKGEIGGGETEREKKRKKMAKKDEITYKYSNNKKRREA